MEGAGKVRLRADQLPLVGRQTDGNILREGTVRAMRAPSPIITIDEAPLEGVFLFSASSVRAYIAVDTILPMSVGTSG